MGLPESWGLDGESQSERCLLHHHHPPSTPTVPEVHRGRKMLPIILPSISACLCSMDIHQGDETLNGSFEYLEHQNSHFNRQHADTGGVQGVSSTALGSVDVPLRSSGLHCQQVEIYHSKHSVPMLPILTPSLFSIETTILKKLLIMRQNELQIYK